MTINLKIQQCDNHARENFFCLLLLTISRQSQRSTFMWPPSPVILAWWKKKDIFFSVHNAHIFLQCKSFIFTMWLLRVSLTRETFGAAAVILWPQIKWKTFKVRNSCHFPFFYFLYSASINTSITYAWKVFLMYCYLRHTFLALKLINLFYGSVLENNSSFERVELLLAACT